MHSFTITINTDVSVVKDSSSKISFEDYLDLTAIMFEWGDSYDTKDWPRLRAILASSLLIDYTAIGKSRWDAMTPNDYMTMVTSPLFLGDPCVKTQHLFGATRWEKVSETRVIGYHQLRAAHQVYTDETLREVKLRGHGYATNECYYVKEGGSWKWGGLKVRVNWNEHEFEKVFKGSYLDDDVTRNGEQRNGLELDKEDSEANDICGSNRRGHPAEPFEGFNREITLKELSLAA